MQQNARICFILVYYRKHSWLDLPGEDLDLLCSDSPLEASHGKRHCHEVVAWLHLTTDWRMQLPVRLARRLTSDLGEGRGWPEASLVPISPMEIISLSMSYISVCSQTRLLATGESAMTLIGT
jgi:hypothetical protein